MGDPADIPVSGAPPCLSGQGSPRQPLGSHRLGRDLPFPPSGFPPHVRSTMPTSSPAAPATPSPTASAGRLDLSSKRVLTNLSSAELVERAVAAGEGKLASNGALV